MPASTSRPTRITAGKPLPTQDQTDYQTIHSMKEKLHEYRMQQIRENLEQERKKAWIHVGNAFREAPNRNN